MNCLQIGTVVKACMTVKEYGGFIASFFYEAKYGRNLSKIAYPRYVKNQIRAIKKYREADGFKFLSEPSRGVNYSEDVWMEIDNPYFYSVASETLDQVEICSRSDYKAQTSGFCRTFQRFMSPSNSHNPSVHSYKRPWKSSDYPCGAVEEELILCGKSVFLDKNNQLEFQYMMENYKNKQFYYFQGGYLLKNTIWSFLNLQKSRLPFYFSMILQTGVYHQLYKIQLLKDHLKRRYVTAEIIHRTQKPEVLDMTSLISANSFHFVFGDEFASKTNFFCWIWLRSLS